MICHLSVGIANILVGNARVCMFVTMGLSEQYVFVFGNEAV